MIELRRTRAGRFDLLRAVTLDELGEMPRPPLIPMADAAAQLPHIELSPDRVEKTKNGLPSRASLELADGAAVRMLDPAGVLIAIGQYRAVEKTVQPKVVFG